LLSADVEKLFKKLDTMNVGAIQKSEMQKLVESVCPDFREQPELDEFMTKVARSTL
jgi:hypothetical protein